MRVAVGLSLWALALILTWFIAAPFNGLSILCVILIGAGTLILWPQSNEGVHRPTD